MAAVSIFQLLSSAGLILSVLGLGWQNQGKQGVEAQRQALFESINERRPKRKENMIVMAAAFVTFSIFVCAVIAYVGPSLMVRAPKDGLSTDADPLESLRTMI